MNQLKPIDMPVYSYWVALYKCFYSRLLYVDVGKRWKGYGFLYMLLVVFILSVPLATRVASVFRQDISQQIMEPLSKTPTLYVQNGEISIDQPIPYFIKNNKGEVVLIIDPTDKINQFDATYPHLHILINKRTIAFKLPSLQVFQQQQAPANIGPPVVQTLSKTVNSVFNGKQFVENSYLPMLIRGTQLMLFPMIAFVLCAFLFVFLPVIALMGQLFSSVFFSFKLSFKQACRLLIVAATPMILILMLFLFVDKVFTGMGILLIGLLIAYYSFALVALRSESQKLVI